jgi:hypothetical protein
MSASTDIGYGQQNPNDADSEHNYISFVAEQLIARLNVSKLVQVKAVTGGGVNPAGTVDVFPLVSQVDGSGNPTAHGIISGIPWSRVQGGKNAIICDPQVGDYGYVVASDRDISNAKTVLSRSPPGDVSKGVNPGSFRRYDIADGVYAGGALNVAPNQYLIFTTTGVRLVDKNGNSIAMSSTGLVLTDSIGNVLSMGSGGITVTTIGGGDFVVNGISVTKHTHAVTTAPGETGIPVG